MKKKIWIVLVVIILVLACVIVKLKMTKPEVNNSSTNENNTIKVEEDELELPELPHEYTIQDAMSDGYVTIKMDGELTNIEKLDLFFENAQNGIEGKIRIVEEYGEKNIAITDAIFDGEKLTISYDYSRSTDSGDNANSVISNEFLISKYHLVKEKQELEGGNAVMHYEIINKEDSEDIYYLTGYVIYD